MTNHLLETQSLYLRKHADNPINWWYWCEDALKEAKSADKPIFLSIGYSSCHWCTVMEGEAFSDPEIAAYLNENFVAIKVDREERPDLDSIYMTALQMMTGQGGWPLNIFLAPEDLVPFYGGTYFPLTPLYGRAGFLQILQSLENFYHHQKDKLNSLKTEIFSELQKNALVQGNSGVELDKDLLLLGVQQNSQVIAQKNQNKPSFPMMPYTYLTLQCAIKNADYQSIAIQRAVNLVNGGIYDHVGGGFHRYTVDGTWTVPHFEKMLYDNGLIMEFLANLWATGAEVFQVKESCEGIYHWLKREMMFEDKYFYASQDADNFADVDDSEPEEGNFYVWDWQELKDNLSEEELLAFQETFYLTEEGNFEGANVLQKKPDQEVTKIIKNCYQKLFKVRYGHYESSLSQFPPARNNEEVKRIPWQGRIPPVTDTKMILSWNSLMVSGLARAYGVFKEEKYLSLATSVVDFILGNQWQNDRLYRLNYHGKISTLAQGEDYAYLIKALLDLSQNGDESCRDYLNQAIAVQNEFDRYCYDEQNGGYYNNAHDDNRNLLIKEKSYIDNATPSTNGIAIVNLLRLSLLTDNLSYLTKAEQTLQLFSEVMQQNPLSCPSLFFALNWYLQGSTVTTNADIRDKFLRQYLPTTVYKTSKELPQDSIGIVCKSFTCFEPATNEKDLLEQVHG